MIKKILLTVLLLLFQFLRYCLLPLLYLLKPFLKFIKARFEFEKSNELDEYAQSYKNQDLTADYLFEVSSEGELEQVLPIINILLSKSKRIELVYSSSSVETKVKTLAKNNKDLIRIWRLNLLFIPFLGESLSSWATSKVVILCRYDFYPELFLLGMKKDINFTLVSASLKARADKSISLYGRVLYEQFNKVILASDKEKERFSFLKLGKEDIGVFDFRLLQIHSRKTNQNETIKKSSESCKNLYHWFESKNNTNKIILGSYWINETELFDNINFLQSIKSLESHVLIAPHSLNRNGALLIRDKIIDLLKSKKLDLNVYLIENNTPLEEMNSILQNYNKKPGVFISLIPAVLVEYYGAFDYSFIGGGHGRSIHSVLEPYIMNTQVFCGPKTYRSTEFDIIRSHTVNGIGVVENMKDFFNQLSSTTKVSNDEILLREKIIEQGKMDLENIMKGFFYV